MGEMFTVLTSFFNENGWVASQVDNQPVLRMGFQGQNGQWLCYAQVREAERQCIVYSVCPVEVPKEKLVFVAEFLTRANLNSIVGNFELDFADGQIRYKTSLDLGRSHFDKALIEPLVDNNVAMMDCYLPGILQVISTSTSPEEAIAQIEE